MASSVDGGADAEGRAAVLKDLFKVSHNTPSTPTRSLTGEIRDRTIWGYWAQGYDEMPDFMKLCVATWQRHNPHWDVRILQKSTVHEYLSEAELPNRFMHLFSHQTASDCVRLALLSRYGGVWLDVNIILFTDLDSFCWDAVSSGRKDAAVFYHPHYGTQAFGGKDLVESWFLAARAGDPFFIKWRDLLRELLHNRLDVDGVLKHPLYQGLDLSGIHRLNQEFGAGFDFREYLAIHSMCHRLLETDARARVQWSERFQLVDAAATAFKLQMAAQALGTSTPEALVSDSANLDSVVDDLPLIKFTTPHYGPLQALSREQLLGPPLLGQQRPGGGQALLGRLLSRGPATTRRAMVSSGMGRPLGAANSQKRNFVGSTAVSSLGSGCFAGSRGLRVRGSRFSFMPAKTCPGRGVLFASAALFAVWAKFVVAATNQAGRAIPLDRIVGHTCAQVAVRPPLLRAMRGCAPTYARTAPALQSLAIKLALR